MTEMLSLLPVLLRKSDDSPEARQQAIFAAWAACVGKQLRAATAPVKVESKTLIVAVRDSTWKSELNRMAGHMLFKLNSILEQPLVTRIEFVINPKAVIDFHTEAPPVVFRSPERQAGALRDRADQIPDPEIRDAFLRA